MLEFFEIGILIAIVGVFALAITFRLKPNPKTAKKPQQTQDVDLEKAYKMQIRTIQENSELENKQLRKINKGLVNQTNGLRASLIKYQNQEYDTEEEDSNETMEKDYEIDWNKAVKVGADFGLDMKNFDINNQVLVTLAKEKIYENKDLALISGILRIRGSNTSQNGNNQQIPTNQTDNIQAIIDTEAAQNPLNTV